MAKSELQQLATCQLNKSWDNSIQAHYNTQTFIKTVTQNDPKFKSNGHKNKHFN